MVPIRPRRNRGGNPSLHSIRKGKKPNRLCRLGILTTLITLGISVGRGADLYWRVDGITGALLTSSNWSSTGSAPYTTAWTNSSNIIFTANSGITNVTNTPVGNITLNDNVTVTWTAAGTFNTGTAVRTVTVGANSTLVWNNQTISGTAGTGFIKNGPGTWNLGTQSNGYGGGFTLNAGTVIVSGIGGLGAGQLNLNGGILSPNTGTGRDFSGKFTAMSIGGNIQFGDLVGVAAGTGDLTFSAAVALGSSTRTVTIGSGGTYTLGGEISGGGAAGLTVNAASGATGVLALGGTNSYPGDTTISGGILRITSAGALPGGSNTRIAGGVLELGTNAPSAFALGTGAGQLQWTGDGGLAAFSTDHSVTLNSGAALTWGTGGFVPDGNTLALGSAAASNTLTLTNDINLGNTARTVRANPGAGFAFAPNAVLSGKITGSGGITITGGGWLSLTGANGYTGGTILLDGTLSVGSDTALGTGTLTFGGGSSAGTLAGNGAPVTLANKIVLSPGTSALFQFGGLAASAMTLDGGISGEGVGFSHTGSNTLTINGDNTFTGIADLPSGTVVIGHDHALGQGIVQFTGATIQGNAVAHTIANSGTFIPFTIAGSSDLTFTGKLTNTYISGTSKITVTNTGTTTFGAIDLSQTSTSHVLEFATGDGAKVVAGGVIGNGPSSPFSSIVKSGPGTVTLANTNTYSGTTTITGGVLEVAVLTNGSGPSGLGQSTSTATNVVLNGGTLRYIGAGGSTNRLFTVGAGASGGALDASGTGLINFDNSGSLNSIGAGVRTLTLTGSNAGDNTLAAAIPNLAGSATSLVKSGSGKWVLSGANTYTGETAINGGTLAVGSSGALGLSGVISFAGGTLQYGASNTTDYSNRFSAGADQPISIDTNGQTVTFATALSSPGGTLTKRGSGTLQLAGTNSYSGGTEIQLGTIVAASSQALGTGPVNLTGGRLRVVEGVTTIANQVIFHVPSSAYELDRAIGASYDAYATKSALGGQATTVTLPAGTAGAARTLTTAFSLTTAATNEPIRASDAFTLTGSGDDVFVLQLAVTALPGSDAYVGALDQSSAWVNAVTINASTNTALAEQQGYHGSFVDFQTTYGTVLSEYLGAFGIDPASNTIWAVVNYSDTFAVVPEPGSTLLFFAAATGVFGLRRRRPAR